MLTVAEMAPGPLPRPPARPPAEPIIIRVPPRPYDDLELEIPDTTDDEADNEIRRSPPWMPDLPPPPPPEDRPAHPRTGEGPAHLAMSVAFTTWMAALALARRECQQPAHGTKPGRAA